MIVKKVKANPRMPKSKAAHIQDLTDYLEREAPGKEEKVLYVNGCNFLSTDYAARQAEMIALAGETVRSRHPVTHWILSWREGEQPSFEQADQAVTIFLDELGLRDHQALYALHRNTDNVHLHIAVNRVHPDTFKVIKPNQGFDREAAHRAIARIEQTHGWQREQAGRYHVLENGEVARAPAPERPREPAQRQRDREHRTGEKSAMRVASEQAAPLIQQAQSWTELHESLARVGMRYERKGSGAILWVGDTAIKASQADRQASLLQLEKRLGAYRPAVPHVIPDRFPARPPEPVRPHTPGWSEYIASRKAHYAEKETSAAALRKQHDQERQALYARQQAQRETILAGRWRGQGALLNALRSTTAAEQAAEKADLKERQQRAWQAHRERFPRFPDLEEWLRQRSPQQAVQWRYRESEPARLQGERYDPPTPRDIRAFAAEVHGGAVHYTRRDEAARGGRVSFVDHGKHIDVHDWNDRASALASLQLAAQKWGRFTVEGRDEYKALCVQLAAEHGFKITNPELQDRIQRERQRLHEERQAVQQARTAIHRDAPRAADSPAIPVSQEEKRMPLKVETPPPAGSREPQPDMPYHHAPPRALSGEAHRPTPTDAPRTAPARDQSALPGLPAMPPIPPGPLPQFERYHAAVNADRYRVTSIKMYPDGGKQTFILDKQNGVTRGFAPEEIERRTPEMQRLERRGENLYYTPLSDHKHHILIDDMDRGKLERLIHDGYKPAVVLESSPGNYQAVITIPKLGTPHDRDVGNRLAEQLNREYGDPKLSGGIHPHRAPGYENRKPKHQREDGSYPEVRLLQAERRECDTTLERAWRIDAQYQRQAQAQAERQAREPRPAVTLPAAASADAAVAAYRAHYSDVLQRTGGADLSRVDAMIAVRMRITGHSQAVIAGALRQCAPAIRDAPESRNWEDYAQRTARYAFSLPADRQAVALAKYRDQWLRLEVREPAREPAPEPHREITRGPKPSL